MKRWRMPRKLKKKYWKAIRAAMEEFNRGAFPSKVLYERIRQIRENPKKL